MRYFDLFERQTSGTYVGVRFSEDTVKALAELQEKCQVPNPLDKTEFHTTVVYSRTEIEWWPEHDLSDCKVTPKGWEVFKQRDGKNCLVLLLDSDYLHSRFALAMDRGATYDFPDYQPHITLSYDIGDFSVDNLPVPDIEIEIDHEYDQPLIIGWKEDKDGGDE